jgi:predicted ArsR family transcriptional regulator
VLQERGIEAEVAQGSEAGRLPFLRQHSCPYFELAEADPAICALERKMFEKVLGRAMRLSACRLDGHRSCDFEAKSMPAEAATATSPAPPTSSPRPPARVG